jgi:hypothetical protein
MKIKLISTLSPDFSQNYFTATSAQLNNPSYQPDATRGLEDDLVMFIPTSRVATKVISTTAKITKATASKTDDIILSTGIKTDNLIQDKVVPAVKDGYYKVSNKFLENPTKYTQGGLDFVDSTLPHGIPTPSLIGGTGFVAGKAYEKITENSNE